MKKSLTLSLALLIAFSMAVKGQAALLVLIFGEKAATENFHFSLKAGINYSIINGYDAGKNRIGANFGLVNNIKLTEKLTLLPEFLPLSSRGIKDVPVITTGNPDLDDLLIDPSSTDRKLSYIDIPVLLKVKLSKRFSISAGPQISFLTGATDIYESSPINDIVLTTEVDIKDVLRTVDLGAVFDLMFIVSQPHNGKGLNLFIRFNQGFMDIVKDNPGDPFTNTTFQFGAVLPFVENPNKGK